MPYRRDIFDPTLVALFWNVLFLLAVLRALNAVVQRWRPRSAFTRGELLSLWVLLCVATSGAGMDSMQCTFMTMQGAFRFAGRENHWDRLFLRYVPRYFTVSDPEALDRLWAGHSSIFDSDNRRVWLRPVVHWWLLMTVLWTTPLGLIQLLRKRWVEHEKMGFPIVQLPEDLAADRVPWLKDPAFWLAAALPIFINLLGGLHKYYPAVPSFPTALGDPRLDFGRHLLALGRPWNAAGRNLFTCLYPFIIGLGLLLPAELCLSMWFFFVVWRLERVTAAWLGFNQMWEAPYTVAAGSYLALIGFPLWAARRVLVRMVVQAFRTGAREPGEPLSARAALLLFFGGFAVLVGFGRAAGLSVPVAVAFFAQYFLMTLIIGRIRAEMGLPTHELERMGPTVLQGTLLGPQVLGVRNLTGLTVFFGFTRGMRNIPFPHQFEGMHFADKTGISARRLLLATVPFLAWGLAWAWFWTLFFSYGGGLGTYRASFHTWFAGEAWHQLAGWLNANAPVAKGRISAGLLGFAIYWVMMVGRTRRPGWPLHPAGFALSTTWYMSHMWFPLLIAWTIKVLAAHWLGLAAVRRLRLVAYGLILGDVGTGALWIIYAMVRHVPAYAFWQ